MAIDPATKCGFATELGEVATLDMTNAKCKLTALRGFILQVHSNTAIHLLAYEHSAMGAFHGGKKVRFATMAFHEKLRGVIEQVANEIGAELLPVNPATLKKFATGHGRATKLDMIRACERQFGLRNLTEDEADARMLLAYAEQWQKRPAEFRTPKERKRIAKKQAKRQPKLF